jgi:acyl-CoA synthetase (NDP forming)
MDATAPIPSAKIDRILRPKSVAIVGASPTKGALGNRLMLNLIEAKFAGDMYLINPRRSEIDGRPALNSIEALPDGVDVAVLAIPRAAVLESVRQLGERGVGGAIIFSAGFAEGGEEGLAEQQAIAQAASDAGMVIMGPNCLGMINFMADIELTFVGMPKSPKRAGKRVGIVSQSGAMAAVIAVTLMSKDIPLSFYISTGNEAQSQTEDYLEYLIGDPDTAVIAAICEQIRQPARFLELTKRAHAAGKTIVLLHPGKSAAGRESAATHTGAMAGDYEVMRVLVERAGLVLAHDLEEMGDIVDLAVRCGTILPGAAILGESGAFKAMSLDTAEAIGLDLPPFTDALSPKLREVMPEFIAVSNPTDLTAQALVDPGLYGRVFEALMEDDRVNSIILVIIQTDHTTANIKFPPIIETLGTLKPNKPVIFAGLDDGAAVPAEYIQALRDLNVPYFPTPDRAFRAVARFAEVAKRDYAVTDLAATPVELPAEGGVIPEYKSKALLAPLGVPFPKGKFAATVPEARAAAAEIGYPVVIKAQSADLSHKSDAGGVLLNIADDVALAEAWETLYANVKAYDPRIALDGVLVEGMGKRGTELIVGARNDPEWGPVVLAGLGGVMAELFHDARLMPPDLTKEAIVKELNALKAGQLLRGFRGSPALDVGAVADLIGKVGAFLRANPNVREIDINPVVVYPEGEGAVALDALMLVAPAQ